MIYLLWCTIRPTMFVDTHKYWMQKCINPENVRTKVAVNTYDDKWEIAEYAATVGSEMIREEDIMVVGNERVGAAYATYCLTSGLSANKDDIVILSSDDFFPPEAWDEFLIEKFRDFSGCLLVRDGFQDFNQNEVVPLTLPIMTFECLEKLNRIICHPQYNHMFADSELYLNVKQLGVLKDIRAEDTVVFEHRHYAVNKRTVDVYDRMVNSFWSEDAKTYDRRIKLPLEERLKV